MLADEVMAVDQVSKLKGAAHVKTWWRRESSKPRGCSVRKSTQAAGTAKCDNHPRRSSGSLRLCPEELRRPDIGPHAPGELNGTSRLQAFAAPRPYGKDRYPWK